MTKINILGQEYEILKQSESENPKLEEADGLCEIYSHKIVLREFEKTRNSYENLEDYKQKVLRHEIIHAFSLKVDYATIVIMPKMRNLLIG